MSEESTISTQSEVALHHNKISVYYHQRCENKMPCFVLFCFPAENHLAKIRAVSSTFKVARLVIADSGQ